MNTLKKAVGTVKPNSPIFTNLPNDFLLPVLLTCSRTIQDLKKIFHDNERMQNIMSNTQAIHKLCRNPFYEWGISGEMAIDFLSEFGSSVENLEVDLSFCQDISDTLLRKLAKSCPNIVSINLSGCTQITDQGIRHFSTNHHLRHLYCFDCPKISGEEAANLRSQLPHCTIYGG